MVTLTVTTIYLLAAIAFVPGVVVVAALYRDIDSKHKPALGYLALIPGFAGVSYIMMAFGIGTIDLSTVEFLGGTGEFVGFRYIDWLITTPLLVGFVGYVGGASRGQIAGVMSADALMIVFGALASVTGGPYQWIFFTISALFHASLFVYLYVIFPQGLSGGPAQTGLFNLLKHHIGLLWLAYPFIWIMAPTGVGYMTGLGASITYAFLDVIAKVPYVVFFYARRQIFTGSDATAIRTESTEEGTTPA